MSIIRGVVASIFGGGVSDFQNPAEWLRAAVGSSRTVSGESVTASSALTVSAYFAALRNLGEDVGKLPLITYKRVGEGKERATDHFAYRMLHDAPNPHMTAMSFRETLTAHAAGWGNGYAEIVRDGAGRPVQMWPIHPSRVEVKVDKETQRLVYEVRVNWTDTDAQGRTRSGNAVRFDQDDIFHLHGLGGDGVSGWSVLRLAAESLGLSIATQKFGAAFFGNSTVLGGTLSFPGKLSDQARKLVRESWGEIHQGATKSHKTAILDEGAKWERLGVPPEEAQFLETRKFSVTEIARWFRMQPHKIMDLERATFTNIEQQSLEYVTDTLMPWLVRWEQETARKIFAGDSIHFCEHLVTGLLRGDSTARGTFYREMFNNGVMSINDIRRAENMNAIPGGDAHFVNGALKTVDQAVREAANGETAEERKLRLQEEIDAKRFKRDLALKFAGDATIGDVIYNATDIKKLMGELGLAREAGYKEPWLPVQGENKPLVTGDLVKDQENDIIGGGIEKGASTETSNTKAQSEEKVHEEEEKTEEAATESAEGDEKLQITNSELQNAETGRSVNHQAHQGHQDGEVMRMVIEATRPVLAHEVRRIKAKEQKAVDRAEKRYRMGTAEADSEGYVAWACEFYDELTEQAIESLGTFAHSILTAAGVDEQVRNVRVCAIELWLANAQSQWAGAKRAENYLLEEEVMNIMTGRESLMLSGEEFDPLISRNK